MINKTLSGNIFIRVAPTIIITILLIGASAFFSATKEINNVYDAQLISDTNVLWTLASDEIQEKVEANASKKVNNVDLTKSNQLIFNDSADDYADSRMFRIWKSNKIMMYSDTALPENVSKRKIGFSNLIYKHVKWRIYTLSIPNQNIFIEMGEKIAFRETLVNNILLRLAIPLLLLIPAVVLFVWLGIRSGLGTIRALIEEIRSRSPDDLSPVQTKKLPKDLMPLAMSLNQLLTKLEDSFNAEKQFTDHAAHQLRTPLAILKLQLQMLIKTTNVQEKQFLIKELLLSNERASKLVGMLLTSARLSYQPVNLYPVFLYQVTAS